MNLKYLFLGLLRYLPSLDLCKIFVLLNWYFGEFLNTLGFLLNFCFRKIGRLFGEMKFNFGLLVTSFLGLLNLF